MQENIDRKLNELRKTVHEQNEKFNKEIKPLKRTNQKSWS